MAEATQGFKGWRCRGCMRSCWSSCSTQSLRAWMPLYPSSSIAGMCPTSSPKDFTLGNLYVDATTSGSSSFGNQYVSLKCMQNGHDIAHSPPGTQYPSAMRSGSPPKTRGTSEATSSADCPSKKSLQSYKGGPAVRLSILWLSGLSAPGSPCICITHYPWRPLMATVLRQF